jgi:hypothetical protein
MKHTYKKSILAFIILQSLLINGLSPYISIRSQGEDAARDLAGMTNFINLHEMCQTYGVFGATIEYSRSFRPNVLTQCLFGPDLVSDICTKNPAIHITGSRTDNRASTDWLADYFGLPTDFASFVSFDPLIQNTIVNLNFYLGLDEWLQGLYFRIDVPITHTKWQLGMRETITELGGNAYDAGYFSATQVPNTTTLSGSLNRSFTDFASNLAVPVLPSLQVADTTFPATTYYSLSNARMSATPLTRVGVAEVRGVVGWNYSKPDYHIGLNIRMAGPTGTKPQGQYAFEPIVGNGHSWQFGFGLTSHYDFWHNCDSSSHAGLFIDANFTHLFRARQHRTFDLKGRPNSRYMLAQKIGNTQLDPHLANPPFPVLEFQSILSPLANLTTFDVDVEIAAQGDIVAMLNYTHEWECGQVSFDLGYNFWGKTCEKIIRNGAPSALDDGLTWALKGDASVIGFEFDSPNPVRLAATERLATIHSGTNFPASGTTDPTVINIARSNPNIDTPLLAETDALTVHINPNSALVTNLQTRSSLSPVFLNLDDVDLSGNRGLTNKIFGHINYAWLGESDWKPYVGAGFEAEFGSKFNCGNLNECPKPCSSSCNPCVNCSVSMWGVWLKAGAAF